MVAGFAASAAAMRRRWSLYGVTTMNSSVAHERLDDTANAKLAGLLEAGEPDWSLLTITPR